MAATRQTVTGVVEQVGRKNDRINGYQVHGRWLKPSMKPDQPLPEAQRGDTISAVCEPWGQDDALFVMAMTITSRAGSNGQRPGGPAPVAARPSTPAGGESTVERLRLQCTQVAATYLALKPDASTSQDLFRTAEEILAWVQQRPLPPAPPDAFDESYLPVPDMPE